MPKCQVCSKQANFNCSRCQNAYYCSKQHQIEHWKTVHKDNCHGSKADYDQILQHLLKKRYHTRKQFYDNYSNKVFDLCLLDAKVMVDFDKKIKMLTGDIIDQYEYGASICVLCRAYWLVKDKNQARIIIQDYLAESEDFLSDIESTQDVNKNLEEKQRQIFQRKMNLISAIANLSFALQLDCIKYYVLYTKHIEKAFGKQSFQASNCYFLIGCYFAQEGFLKKAIACFLKSAALRGPLGGDCYFNIGILYAFQNKYSKALEMFDTAFKLRMQQYGQDSEQLAQVQENTGMIYVELNDFITAMQQYEKAFKVRSSNPYSAQYRNIIDLIHQLYDKLSLYIGSEQVGLKKPSIFLHLKTKIEDEEVYWKQRRDKKENLTKKEQQQAVIAEQKKSKKKTADVAVEGNNQNNKTNDAFLIVTDQLMSQLSPAELYQLSDLQLELSGISSTFARVFMVGKSQFLKKISPENFQILRRDNPKLFELIRLQQIQKEKQKK